MTPAGWLFMTVSIGAVLSLASWCYWQVLKPGTASGSAAGESGDEPSPKDGRA